jgi:tRNA uridine 5-carboxymethylaminomethyl modification enzyme
LEHEHNLLELLRRPGIGFDTVAAIEAACGVTAEQGATGVTRAGLSAELDPELAGAVI